MQKLNIPSHDETGETLDGELYEADSDKFALLLQGAGAMGKMWRPKAKEFADRGINTMIAEYRMGESGKEVNFMKHREDTKAMLEFAEQELGFEVRNVIAHCYGGSHAIANAENINGKMILETPFLNALSFISKNKQITSRYLLPAIVDMLGLKTDIKLADKEGLYRHPSAEKYNELDKQENLGWKNACLARELMRCPVNFPITPKNKAILKDKAQSGDLAFVNPMDDPIINPNMTKRFAEKLGAPRFDKPVGHFGVYDDKDLFDFEVNFLKDNSREEIKEFYYNLTTV